MFAYALRRILVGALMLVVMSMVTYVLFFASSPQPERYACGTKCTEQQLLDTKKALGYDQPIATQWAKFAKGIVAGRSFPEDKSVTDDKFRTDCPAPCLGISKYYGTTVTALIKDRLPVSASLAIIAFVIWMVVAVLLGIVAALRKATLLDRGIVGISLIAYAFPSFFIGLLFLQYLTISPALFDAPKYTSLLSNPVAWLTGLLLPAITLALLYIAGYIRITRAFVLETSTEDYIRTARAKGLTQRVVVGKHTLRAVLTPLVTMSGLDLAGLLGGAIITENVFSLDGLGRLATASIGRFDLPVVVGVVLLVATFVIIANIIVDLLYAVIDPRVRLG